MADDYTPSLEEAREQYWAASGDPRRDSGAWGEFDRMIETVRAEEREKADREPSDAAVEAAAASILYENQPNSTRHVVDWPVSTADAVEIARAALIAAQEVRDES